MIYRWLFLPISIVLLGMLSIAARAQKEDVVLRVPGFTAYSEPSPEALEFTQEHGVTGWTDSKQSVVWYGEIKNAGWLDLAVDIRLPETEAVTLRLTVGGKAFTATAQGQSGETVTVSFPSVELLSPGYCRFALQGVQKAGRTFGDVKALVLGGPAAEEAHFNLKERRNASSVHLGYAIPAGAKVVAFTNEVTVKTDPLWSYYMACGFRRGYFGIQVNSPTERRIIFSVWDSGNEGVDRSKVAPDDRV
ncbi:MAG: hypothetical protein JWL77_3954, partial [Chthonomonadaceae bacterium]|nr:hypothetical protein [Chthonomonadaceae bacterium]